MSERGRLLGVDYGEKRVGLAVCDPDRIIASPLQTFERDNPAMDAEYLRNVARSEQVVGIVVGLPAHTDGREGVKAAEARAYGGWLAEITGLTVHFWDERFTTANAEAALWDAGLSHKRRKDRRDRVAAQMMLQSFLDAGCPDNTGL